MMNSTSSHEMRNPLNSIKSQTEFNDDKINELEKKFTNGGSVSEINKII